jgi:hypothetical protein
MVQGPLSLRRNDDFNQLVGIDLCVYPGIDLCVYPGIDLCVSPLVKTIGIIPRSTDNEPRTTDSFYSKCTKKLPSE